MTEKELIDYGYTPMQCKMGILYFKGDFFCKLQNGVVDLRLKTQDMLSEGTAETLEELKILEKNYYIKMRDTYSMMVKTYDLIIKKYDE